MKKLTLFISVLLLWCATAYLVHAKEVVGWVEKVIIYPGELVVKAKIDSGAKTSSLNCKCYNFFERDGKEWVKFTVVNFEGETTELEKPVVRIAKIKRHYGDKQERPVVKLGLCLANTYKETEFTLIDRSGLNYQVLVGRQFLEDAFLIDPGESFTRKPECNVD
jgi:hypothetical protein